MISAVIVAYNSGPALVRCLDALAAERRRGAEVEAIVVNNGDQAEEIERARGFDFAQVLSPGANLGFAAASNLGAEQARGELLFFLNPDTMVGEGTLDRLEQTLADDALAIAMPRLLLYEQPDRLNSAGCVIHLAGLAWSSGYGEPAETLTDTREITYANGSVLAIRRDRFEELGRFTPELFIYHEDLELGWRARMRGWRIAIEARADVLHDYSHTRNPAKNYFMERNRLIFVATAYSGRTLLLLAPVLVGAELGLTGLALKEGWFRDKARGWAWCARNRAWIRGHRRRLQAARTVPDRELAAYLTPVLDPGMIAVPRFVRAVVNPLLAAYWSVARRAL
jgi:GT2 family glycosyltransferase